jgi:hypothetical protein
VTDVFDLYLTRTRITQRAAGFIPAVTLVAGGRPITAGINPAAREESKLPG